MSPTASFGHAAIAASIALVALLMARTAASIAFAAVVLGLSSVAAYTGYSAHRDLNDFYVVRKRMQGSMEHLQRIEERLRSACRDGLFHTASSVQDLDTPEPGQPALAKAALRRLSASRVRARMEFQEMRATTFMQLDPRVVVPAGAMLELEFACDDRVFASRRAESTLEPKYLPSAWRSP